MPSTERFELAQQMRKAAVSVGSNIAARFTVHGSRLP
ncbi:MAG: four helix bundle protein [Gemmatimonadaceae bacterium]|nr:four helix bundle protein [Gemmatimonadaceae bacterium]NUP54419.1 four helix bundle protein [Gemmatimonadaceae bacterium]NUP72428.1 four helix bundle protein [Gemmatimonadaceae bacterium]NUR33281.1 four helix bundle protein [Gemmatimonadaceae bacterium]NUS32570.1 four helix bundle protein [Gemmatimonadaceae bacterium]